MPAFSSTNWFRKIRSCVLTSFLLFFFCMFLLFVAKETRGGSCGIEGCTDDTLLKDNCFDCPLFTENLHVEIKNFAPTPGNPTNGSWVLCISGGGHGRILYSSYTVKVFVCVLGFPTTHPLICQTLWSPDSYCGGCTGSIAFELNRNQGDTIKVCLEVQQENPPLLSCIAQSDPIDVILIPPDTTKVDSTLAFELGAPDDQCQSFVGEPINVSNGNVFRKEKDASISSGRGLPVEFVRSYNSFSTYVGSFGYSWKHSFDYSLVKNPVTGDVTLKEGSGREMIFKYPPWHSNANQYIILTRPYGIFYELKLDTLTNSYILTKADDTKWYFDSSGKLDSIADRNNNQINLSYSSDTLKTITNSSGRRLTLEYNGIGLISTVKDGGGSVLVTYEYNNDSTLKKVTRNVSGSSADTTAYTYQPGSSSYKRITKITNSDGGEYNYTYDNYGRATSSYQANGVDSISISYASITGDCPCFTTKTTVVDSRDDTSRYFSSWDPSYSRRLLREVENPSCGGCYVQFDYGPYGEILSKLYENGVADSFTYDFRGNLLQEIRAVNKPLAQTTNYTYHPDFHLVTRKEVKSSANPSDKGIITYKYDTNGNLKSVIDSGWVDTSTRYCDTTNYSYNSYGQLTEIDGPRSDVSDLTIFYYKGNGDLDSTRQYANDSTILVIKYSEYDSLGNPQLIADPNGVKTRYFYDRKGRTSKIINGSNFSDSTITQYAYNSYGNVTQIIRPNGDTIKYNYDSANRLASKVNGVKDSLKYIYDAEGNLTKKEIASHSGVVTWYENYEYDTQKDLLTKITGPYDDNTIFRYDQVGNRTLKINANGVRDSFVYDDLNRLTEVLQFKNNDTLKTFYTYDSGNNLKTVTDADSNLTSYKYSDKGLLTEDSSAVTGVTKYQYDEAGNLFKKKDSAGDSILYNYDALNRLTLIDFQDDNKNIGYVYDDSIAYRKGRLFKEQAPYDTITYSYKYTSLLAQEDKKIADVTYTTKYSYDKNGNLTYLEYNDGRKLFYYYDKADQLDSLRTSKIRTTKRLITNMDYAPYGGPTSFTYGNGITTTIKYNQRYWVDSLATDTNVVRRKYRYDKVGNITKIKDLLYSAKSESLYYDDLNRLTFAYADSFPGDTLRYEYSDAGNRLRKISGTDTTFYHYSTNKLVSTTGYEPAIYRYDNKGNVIVDSTIAKNTLGYDQLNRLISFSGTTEEQYYYDGEGKRIKKDYSGSNEIVFLYDQWGNLISEADTTGNFICDYIWANGRLVAKIYPKGGIEPQFRGGAGIESVGPPPVIPPDSDLVFYYHLDHLGTPLALTMQNRSRVWVADYLPFGELYSEIVFSASNDIRFPGQYHDRETDLYYNWHRYYKPTLGRYYQADPLVLSEGLNQFIYVKNNPINLSDPAGLKECCDKLGLEKCVSKAKNRRFTCRVIWAYVLDISGTPCLIGCLAAGEAYATCVLWSEGAILLPVALGWATCEYNYYQDVKKCKTEHCKKL